MVQGRSRAGRPGISDSNQSGAAQLYKAGQEAYTGHSQRGCASGAVEDQKSGLNSHLTSVT